MSWVEALVQNLLAILAFVQPFRVMRPYQRAVVFRFGHYSRTMDEGFHWMWPCRIEEIEIVHVAEETKNLVSQSITTADGVAVTFSVNIVFRVVDAQKYVCNVHDFDESLATYAMTHLAKRVRERDWDALLTGQKELERSLEGTLSTRVEKWGAEIVSVGITDLVKSRQFRFFGDPPRVA